MKRKSYFVLLCLCASILLSGCKVPTFIEHLFEEETIINEDGSIRYPKRSAIFLSPIGNALINTYNFPDGEYYVILQTENSNKNSYNIRAYDYDSYDPAGVDSLNRGDTIQLLGSEIKISNIEKTSDTVKINKGIEDGGITLRYKDDTYYAIDENARPLLYFVGNRNMDTVSDVCLICGDNTIESQDSVWKYITEHTENLSGYVKVTIKDDKICQLSTVS